MASQGDNNSGTIKETRMSLITVVYFNTKLLEPTQ